MSPPESYSPLRPLQTSTSPDLCAHARDSIVMPPLLESDVEPPLVRSTLPPALLPPSPALATMQPPSHPPPATMSTLPPQSVAALPASKATLDPDAPPELPPRIEIAPAATGASPVSRITFPLSLSTRSEEMEISPEACPPDVATVTLPPELSELAPVSSTSDPPAFTTTSPPPRPEPAWISTPPPQPPAELPAFSAMLLPSMPTCPPLVPVPEARVRPPPRPFDDPLERISIVPLVVAPWPVQSEILPAELAA